MAEIQNINNADNNKNSLKIDLPLIKEAIVKLLPSNDLNELKKLLLDENLTLVEYLVKLVSFEQSREEELVDLLTNFFEQHGRLPLLIRWSVKHEVDSADEPDDLFRKGSFGTQLLFRYFFNESGLHFLKSTVGPLITEICKTEPSSLEIEPESTATKIKPEMWDRNLSFLFGRTAKFFERLNDTLTQFPFIIRYGFYYLQKEVKRKFPASDSVIPVVLFLRYLCPTILQPHIYGLTKSPPNRDSLKALLIVSKLIQNIANGIVKNNITHYSKHETKIKSFIERHMNDIKKFCDSLINDREIARLEQQQQQQQQQISHFNYEVSPQSNETLKRILSFINEVTPELKKQNDTSSIELNKHEQNPGLTSETEFEFTREQQERLVFLKKDVDSRSWQISKAKDGYKLFVKKSRTSQEKRLFAFKVEGTIHSTLELLLSYLKHLTVKDLTSLHSNIVTEQSRLLWSSESLERQMWKLQMKFPFPFHDREVCFVRHIIQQNPHEAVVVCLPHQKTFQSIPHNKNTVKTEMELMILMKSTVERSDQCFVIFTFHIDPKGQFPKSMKKTLSRSFLDVCLSLQSSVESHYRNQSTVSFYEENSRPLISKQQQQQQQQDTGDGSSVRSRSVSVGSERVTSVRFHTVNKPRRNSEMAKLHYEKLPQSRKSNEFSISQHPLEEVPLQQKTSPSNIESEKKLRRLSLSHVNETALQRRRHNTIHATQGDKRRSSLTFERRIIRDVHAERDELQISPTSHHIGIHSKESAPPLTPHHTKFLDYLVESTPSSSTTHNNNHNNNNKQEVDTQDQTQSSTPRNTIRNPVRKLKLLRRMSEGNTRRHRYSSTLSDNSESSLRRHEVNVTKQPNPTRKSSIGSNTTRRMRKEEEEEQQQQRPTDHEVDFVFKPNHNPNRISTRNPTDNNSIASFQPKQHHSGSEEE